MNLARFFPSFFQEGRGTISLGRKIFLVEHRSVAARQQTVRFRFVCRDVYSILPIPLAMITGCSCIRPASKTNRSHIYQQFKAAGRDCRYPVGFLRVSADSYCDRVAYLDSPSINGSLEGSRKLRATPHDARVTWCHYRHRNHSGLINATPEKERND